MPTEVLERAGIRLSVQPPIMRATLARPENRNAQTPATWRGLAAIGDAVTEDVRLVILDADGPSFSAGLDRRMLDGTGVPGEPDVGGLLSLGPGQLDAALAEFQRGFTWWREVRAVTVAAVQGHAIGAGFQLALACDLMVCADDAQLAMRETSLGLVPDLGGTARLAAAAGYPRALEICATGRWVGPQEAVDLGLAVAAVPAAELTAAVEDLAAALLAAPAAALSDTKALLRDSAARPFAEQLAAERAASARRLRALGQPAEPG